MTTAGYRHTCNSCQWDTLLYVPTHAVPLGDLVGFHVVAVFCCNQVTIRNEAGSGWA